MGDDKSKIRVLKVKRESDVKPDTVRSAVHRESDVRPDAVRSTEKVRKETLDRKEKEPVKIKDEKGKVVLSKPLQRPESLSSSVTPKATNGGLSSNVEKLPPDRKEKEPVKSKDEKGLGVLSKTLKKPETVGAKVTPKASNGGLVTTVDKVTPDRKEKEPMKAKDEKGKVPLSKMLRKPEAVNAKVTPKATNGGVSSSAVKVTPDRKEKESMKSKDEKRKMMLSKSLKKPEAASTKLTSNATNGGVSPSSGKLVKKVTVTTIKTTTNTTTKTVKEEKREKKVFTLPGQKHEPPEERDALRIFYETLHDQIPSSEMAEVWMMEHGLLPLAEAKEVLERKQKRAQYQKNGTPVKSSTPLRHSNGSVEKRAMTSNGKSKTAVPPKGKKKRDESDSDDDFIRPVKKKLKA